MVDEFTPMFTPVGGTRGGTGEAVVRARQFGYIFEVCPTALVMSDPDGCILAANPAAERLLARQRSAVIGRPLASLCRPASTPPAGEAAPAAPVAGRRRPGRERVMLAAPNGEHPVEIENVAVDEATCGAAYLHSLRPLSAVDDLTPSQAALLMEIVHELQTPVASLQIAVDVLIEDFPRLSAARRQAKLTSLRRSSVRIQRLIRDLFDYCQSRTNSFTVNLAPAAFDTCVLDAVAEMRPVLERKGQRCVVALPNELIWVEGDSRRLTQVVVNLLSNASKYSPPGSAIGVRLEARPGWGHLTIIDEGEGIPPEEIPHVFGRFYRRNRPVRAGGLGLGLAIVKAIVDAHRGRIAIAGPGKGTEVRVDIPICTAMREAGSAWHRQS